MEHLNESKDMSCENIKLEPAVNGFILSYVAKIKDVGSGPYDSMKYVEKEEVFTAKEGSKALARMAALYKAAGGEMEGMEDD